MAGFISRLGLLAAVTVSLASFAAAEFNKKEELILADCGIGTMPNKEHSRSRYMAYYANGFHGYTWDGKDLVQPDMMVEIPWDGSYPWRKSGAAGRMPNGDLFQVFIDPAVGDFSRQYAGHATHTYDSNQFQCAGLHGQHAFKSPDGFECTTAYICLHDPRQAPSPQPGKKATSDFTMSRVSESVRVQGTDADLKKWSPASAFQHINEATEGLQCNNKEFAIGNECSITFRCLFSVKSTTPILAKVLTNAVAPAVESSGKMKKGHYKGKCRPNGDCDPGYDYEYKVYEYPSTGTVLMSTTDGTDVGTNPQSWITWEVKCAGSGFCGTFCKTYTGPIIDAVAGVAGFPPLMSIACAGC